MRRVAAGFFSVIILALAGSIALAHEGHQKEHKHPFPEKDFSLKRGASLYKQYCASCDGQTGYHPGPFPDYMDPRPANFLDRGYVVMRSRVDLFESVRDGRPGTRMKAWEERLEEDEIWDVVAWIDHLFNHAAQPVAHKH